MRKLVVILIFLGFSCTKNNSNDCSQAVCPAIYIAPPQIKFTLSDKITTQDLFFAIPPKYPFKDLVVFKMKNVVDTTHLPVYIDSLNVPKYLASFTVENAYTFFIQIQNQKADTIDVVSRPVITGCCLTDYIVTSLKLNGKLICTDCDRSIIVEIKK